jgi:predicted nucleic acid-binding protein
MGAYYGDSSALVKRYANETGSRWVRSLTEPQAGNDIFTAHITGIEVVSAIARKIHRGEISGSDATSAIRIFQSHFKTQYQIVLMSTEVVDRAMALAEKHRLRGYDATRLASALVVHDELVASGLSQLVFISADIALNEVARAEKLPVQNPNDRPLDDDLPLP